MYICDCSVDLKSFGIEADFIHYNNNNNNGINSELQ